MYLIFEKQTLTTKMVTFLEQDEAPDWEWEFNR